MVGCGWSGQHSMWTCKSRESQTEEDWVSGQAADVVVQTGEHWPFTQSIAYSFKKGKNDVKYLNYRGHS